MASGLGGGLGSQRGELPLMADVNVTALVDVMLVMLITFMITAPMMQGGVDVELPTSGGPPAFPQGGDGGIGQSERPNFRRSDSSVLF